MGKDDKPLVHTYGRSGAAMVRGSGCYIYDTKGKKYLDFGAGIAVTALGMFGVDGFTPIINQPNTAIVGIGRIRDETTWASGQPERSQALTLSLTWDHRAFDGAPAAQFAAAIKAQMESPLRLLA